MTRTKRSTVNWSEHELHVTEHDGILIHDFKKPGTNIYRVTFINARGILAVTGDCYNWIFCREFHPSPDGAVSDSYWCEKLRIASKQDPYLFDPEATKKALEEAMNEEEVDGETKEYYEQMISEADEGKEIYLFRAHEDKPSWMDHDSVIYRKRLDYSLECVFDAFDEICSRLATPQVAPNPKTSGDKE